MINFLKNFCRWTLCIITQVILHENNLKSYAPTWKTRRKKRDRENMICTIFFVFFFTSFVEEYSGECCRKIFRVGTWFTITSRFGQSLMKTQSVFWSKKKFGRSWTLYIGQKFTNFFCHHWFQEHKKYRYS